MTLVKTESAAFERIEVHEMATVDGLMEMREINNLVIPAKDKIHFQPGGKHLMLMGPREYWTEGQQVRMTLTFESGSEQSVQFRVAAR